MAAKTFLWFHFVFTTKYRRPTLVEMTVPRVLSMIQAVTAFHRGEVLELNTGEDHAHLHLLVALPPTVALSDFVRDAKSASSRRAGRDFHWGVRYFGRTVGAGSLAAARQYVASQHSNQTETLPF